MSREMLHVTFKAYGVCARDHDVSYCRDLTESGRSGPPRNVRNAELSYLSLSLV